MYKEYTFIIFIKNNQDRNVFETKKIFYTQACENLFLSLCSVQFQFVLVCVV